MADTNKTPAALMFIRKSADEYEIRFGALLLGTLDRMELDRFESKTSRRRIKFFRWELNLCESFPGADAMECEAYETKLAEARAIVRKHAAQIIAGTVAALTR